MSTSKDNVQLMIEAFTDYRAGSDHSLEATDSLLRVLLDNSKVPSTQVYDYASQSNRDMKANPFTDEEQAELVEMRKLLSGRFSDVALWESHEDLMTLLITYPPVILEQLLITGMVIYLLRADDTGFYVDSDNFNEFYRGWGSVVCECIDLD